MTSMDSSGDSSGEVNPLARTCGLLVLGLLPLIFSNSVIDSALIPKLLVSQFLVLLFALVWLAAGLRGDNGPRLLPLDIPVFLFFAFHLISWPSAINPFKTALELSRAGMATILYLAVSRTFQFSSLRSWLSAASVTAAVVSVVGIAEYVGVDFQIRSSGYPSATFFYRNFAAMYLIVILPLMVAGFLSEPKGVREFLWAAAGTLGSIFLVYTRTRGAWLGIGCALLIAGSGLLLLTRRGGREQGADRWRPGRRKLLIAGLSLVLVAGASQVPPIPVTASDKTRIPLSKMGLMQNAASIFQGQSSGRLPIWKDTMGMILERPLLGAGLGNWELVFPTYAQNWSYKSGTVFARPHNDYLWIASELGVPALVAYLWMLAAGLLAAWRLAASAQKPLLRWGGVGMATSILALSIHAFFSFPRERIMPTVLLWLLLGVLAGATAVRSKKGKTAMGWRVGPPLAACTFLVWGMVTTVRAWGAEEAYLGSLAHQELEQPDAARQEAARSMTWGVPDYRVFITKAAAHRELGDFPGAVSTLERCIASYHPNSIAAHQNLGSYAYGAGMLARSVVAYRRAIELDPLNVGHRMDLAVVLQEEGSLDLAAQQLEQAERMSPRNRRIPLLKGSLERKRGDLQEALVSYRAAADLDSNALEAHREIGAISVLMGQRQSAIEAFEHVVRLEPTSAETYLGLGVLYEEAGDLPQAAHAYERFLEHWQGGEQAARDVSDRLRNLRSP